VTGQTAWQKIRAEEILRAHLEGEIRIADLATACQLSPSHFSRCFRQSFGTSVHQWLIKLRIDTAKSLLRQPELSLAEVGFRSGFCDQAAFTRASQGSLGLYGLDEDAVEALHERSRVFDWHAFEEERLVEK
jgi:AraC family transcriptional regulator